MWSPTSNAQIQVGVPQKKEVEPQSPYASFVGKGVLGVPSANVGLVVNPMTSHLDIRRRKRIAGRALLRALPGDWRGFETRAVTISPVRCSANLRLCDVNILFIIVFPRNNNGAVTTAGGVPEFGRNMIVLPKDGDVNAFYAP